MKIKKKTSLMMIAASTAAVMGVAAVSFAAWSGAASNTVTASASTGKVELIGFSSATATDLPALVPVDQGSGNIVSSTSVTYTVTDLSTISGKYEITTTDNAVTELSLWVKLTDNAALTTTEIDPNKITAAEGWIELGKSDTTINAAVAASDVAVTKYVNVVLKSSNLADMNQTYTLTLSIAKNAS